MPPPSVAAAPALEAPALLGRYRDVRATTEALCRPLQVEDYVLQAMPDVSPTQWHLAHVSWFFETFLLEPHLADYRPLDPALSGPVQLVLQRRRPPVLTARARSPLAADGGGGLRVSRARRSRDGRLAERPAGGAGVGARVELGLQHEQQHQELILTDIKYNLGVNPLRPAYHAGRRSPTRRAVAARLDRRARAASCRSATTATASRSTTRGRATRVLLAPFRLADPARDERRVPRVHRRRRLSHDWRSWLSEGWRIAQERGWQAPLYWERETALVGADARRAARRSIDTRPVVPRELLRGGRLRALARAHGCRRKRSGSTPPPACPIDGNFQERGVFHPLPRAARRAICARCSATCGSGRRARTRPIPASGRRPGARRRVQRQVHGEPDGPARRLVRDAAVAHPRELSQLLPSRCPLAVLRHPAAPRTAERHARAPRRGAPRRRDAPGRARARTSAVDSPRARGALPPKYFYDAAGSALFDGSRGCPSTT